MNKAITDGVLLMPPAFRNGLGIWSSEDGTPGSATYASAANAALVPSDPDFGPCLELHKTQPVQKLRHMGETPLLPGCYLRVSARVKAVAGALGSVRIAGWAGGPGGVHVGGLVETGPAVALAGYGEIANVSAIVGAGARTGVDMIWGSLPLYGHFGLDLTGANGGTVRIEDIRIEDVTSVFLRKLMDWVDVRDYGARGDGVSDDSAAFNAADAAALAAGQTVLVSAGTYHLPANVTMAAPVRFEGRVTMPVANRLCLLRSFDLPTYAAAFGGELEGFRKAFQALLNFADHDGLDLGGRRIEVDAPLDMQAIVANKTAYNARRTIRNGQFNVLDGPAWEPTVVTAEGSYSPAAPYTLSGVTDAALVPVGALVQGAGVGREVYVRARDPEANTLTLSQPLHGGAGTQVFTFTRFKYVLDFSGFEQLDRMNIDDVEFLCNGRASAIMLAPSGTTFHLRDCYVTRPRDRGITSTGTGCQDLLVDRCQFLSNEMPLRSQDRTSVALNINANDAKIRDNRFVRFGHFAVMKGNGHLIVGNHWFQGDDQPAGLRVAGLVLAETNLKTTITGNYIDNSFIEWTNEYQPDPAFGSQYSFGGLTLTGNICTVNDVAPWFSWLVIKPFGPGHFIHGLNVSGNVFKSLNGPVDRVERVDTSFAGLDMGRMRNVTMQANSFNAVGQVTANPVFFEHVQETAQTVWTIAPGAFLPFGGWARNVDSIVAEGPITTAAGARVTEMPHVLIEQGPDRRELRLHWSVAARGKVRLALRMDNSN